MKKLLSLALIFLSVHVFAQNNFSRFSIGAGGGITNSFTDVQKSGMGIAYNVNLDYYFTPFVTAGIEAQFGKIKGGDKITDPHLRAFENSYSAVIFNAKLQLGELVDYNSDVFLNNIKGFYLGSGVGFVKNNLTDIVRVQPGTGYVFPGLDKSTNLLVPLNVGFNFEIPDGWGQTRFIFNVNYQFNVTFGEGLDGYNDPPALGFKNSSPDMYSYTSIGIKYCFGSEGLNYRPRRR